MYFSTNRSQKCAGQQQQQQQQHHRQSGSDVKRRCTLLRSPLLLSAPPCGRRGCSDAVIQWAPASSGRSAASLSQRHFCARQVGTVSHSAPEKKKLGSGNYWGVLGEEDSSLPSSLFLSFFPPLTRGPAKMNVGCVILACTALVGASTVRWVNFLHVSSVSLDCGSCSTAVLLTWSLAARRFRALESVWEGLTLSPQRCAKGNMMRVIALNTATFRFNCIFRQSVV